MKSFATMLRWTGVACLTATAIVFLEGFYYFYRKWYGWHTVDYGTIMLLTIPGALLQGFLSRRKSILPLIIVGWLVAAGVAIPLLRGRVLEDCYCDAYVADYQTLCMQHIFYRLAAFLAIVIPFVAAALSAIGFAIGRRSLFSAKRDTLSTISTGVTGLFPLLLFVDFSPPECDPWGLMFYDPTLCAMTVAAIVCGFIQGALLRASFSIRATAVGWECAAFCLAWIAVKFHYAFPLDQTLLRLSELEMSLQWRSVLYIISAVPIAGAISTLWGRRWDDSSRRPIHLAPPLTLIVVLIAMFVYLWHM